MTSPSRIPASRGWQWLTEAWHTVRQWPQVFVPMGLIIAGIHVLPYIGGLVILVAGPALVAGTVVAADTAARGGTPAFRQLVAMFEADTTRGESLKLCLPSVIGKFVAGMLVGIVVARRLMQAGVDPESLGVTDLLKLLASGDMIVWLLLAAMIVLLAWTFLVLAIPRVALHQASAFDAMRAGVAQAWRGIGAWAIVALVLFGLALFAGALLYVTGIPAIMVVGAYTVLYTLLGPVLYAAWRDINARVPNPDSSSTTTANGNVLEA